MLTWATTPYLAELEKTYEASQFLDARVTFVTERQIRNGRLDRFKLLLVPAVRNVPADVVERIWGYAAAGGRVLIVPESFLGDEYNRQRDFLERLGVTVVKTERPKTGSIGGMAQGYDQSFSQDVTLVDNVRVGIKPAPGSGLAVAGSVEVQGVRQSLRVGPGAAPLFQFPDGSAAIVRTAVGKGAVYYSAGSLEARSYARVLDALFTDAGVTRPVRVRSADGKETWQIECRLAESGGRRLLYVVNFQDQPVRLKLSAPEGFFRSLRDLRGAGETRVTEISLEAGRTGIYEMF